MESNPAQVTVRLSHNSNGDMCEALISKNVSFDLSTLKKYLKQNFNIQDKVVLLLFDSSGMPLRNPVIEYNY
jgi:regulator of sigma D